jgi:predicted extracellular nuclease
VLHYANDATRSSRPWPAVRGDQPPPRRAEGRGTRGHAAGGGRERLNYFTTLGSAGRGASNPAEFERQKAKTVAALRGLNADVITLMEVENNDETALNDLVATLNVAIDPSGQRREYAPVVTGKVGTDQIASR